MIDLGRHCERSEAIHRLNTPIYGLLRRFASRNDGKCRAYFSPTLNGGSLPGGTVSSAIASSIATMT
jgi:hypothetical protein